MEKYASIVVSLSETDLKNHLGFLREVDSVPQLQQPHVLMHAARRYELFWLPLLASESAEKFYPPLDVEWIWHVHLLSPRKYADDCRKVIGKIPQDRKLISNQFEKNRHISYTKERWTSLYPGEVYDFDPLKVPIDPILYETKLQYDVLGASERQHHFYYNVSLPHYLDDKFLQSAIERYQQFLALKKQNPDCFVVPMYDVDLVWHTHQLKHQIYEKETTTVLGRILNHDDTTTDRGSESKLSESDHETRKLWRAAYQSDFPIPGAMYRGKDSKNVMKTIKREDISKHFETLCVLQVLSLSVTSENTKAIKYGGKICLTEEDIVIEQRNLAEMKSDKLFEWKNVMSCSPTSSSCLTTSSIVVYIKQAKSGIRGLLGSKKDVEVVSFSLTEHMDKLVSSCTALPIEQTYRLNGGENNMELVIKISMMSLVPEKFCLSRNGFSQVNIDDQCKDHWLPVALPTLPDGVPNTVLQATHR